MKLYTEDQLRQAYIDGMDFIAVDPTMYEQDANEYITGLTPIELPSDNKIRHEAITQMEEWYGSGCEEEIFAFINGAKYVVNKIQGGNQ